MTQNSRKSLIELLFLSLYLDQKLSLAEDEVLTEALDSLGWDSPMSRENFIFSAFAAARAVVEVPEKTEEFLVTRADAIREAGDEASAMTWLTKVLASDGLTDSERYFLKKLEDHLYPNPAI